jgi:hypothetical protein
MLLSHAMEHLNAIMMAAALKDSPHLVPDSVSLPERQQKRRNVFDPLWRCTSQKNAPFQTWDGA